LCRPPAPHQIKDLSLAATDQEANTGRRTTQDKCTCGAIGPSAPKPKRADDLHRAEVHRMLQTPSNITGGVAGAIGGFAPF